MRNTFIIENDQDSDPGSETYEIQRKDLMKMQLKKQIVIFLAIILICVSVSADAKIQDTILLPASIHTIREEAFLGAASIQKVIVPEGVTEIQSRAFAESSLKEINLPDSLESIADDAFQGCENLKVAVSKGSYAHAWALQNPNVHINVYGFEAHFIDVGQGDSAVVICDNEVLMIDGGKITARDTVYSYLRDTLNIDHIDYLIATHPHYDHIGGLPGAFDACSIGKVFTPITQYNSTEFQALEQCVQEQGLQFTVPSVGDVFQLGSAAVQFIHPKRIYEGENDTSIVVRIVYGDTSFLFAADTEEEAENDMVASGMNLASTFLKVGYHGSQTSSTSAFLQKVKPQYAVVSVGLNSTGKPASEALNRLEDLGTVVYRTDKKGNIVCFSDGKALSFEFK